MKLTIQIGIIALPLGAFAGVLQSSDFSSGWGPFSACNVKSPSHVTPEDGTLTVYFDEADFDGTRNDRGAEFCVFEDGTQTNVKQMKKEAWQGFSVYIPSASASESFPEDKATIIAQQFCPGGCSSWCGTIEISNNDLVAEYRSACAEPTTATLVEGLDRDIWHDLVIHMRVSQEESGAYEVWHNGEQVHSEEDINVGFGDWDGDVLESGWYFKNGMYAWGKL